MTTGNEQARAVHTAIEERIAAAKDNAVLQAQIWAQEARTQRATVLEILRYFGLPENDWEALRLIRAHTEGTNTGNQPDGERP